MRPLDGEGEVMPRNVVNQAVNEFVEQVQPLVDSVATVQNPSFRKVLYLVMSDGLSTLRFPDHWSAGNRFVNFVNIYGGWPHCVRVSLPQAHLLLSETKGSDPALLAAVSDRLAQWPVGRLLELDLDPFPEELDDAKGLLRDCQHGRLLWAFRNTLLHEFRYPGHAFEELSPSRDAPYYHQVDFVEGPLAGQIGWELAIPAEFLKRLTLNCLNDLAAWLRSEQIDPRSIGYQGRSWVTRLRRLNPQAGGG